MPGCGLYPSGAGASSEIHERIATEDGGRLGVDVSTGHVIIEGHEEDLVEIEVTSLRAFPGTPLPFTTTAGTSGWGGYRESGLPFGSARVRVETDDCFEVSGERGRKKVRGEVGGDGESLRPKASGGNLQVKGSEGEPAELSDLPSEPSATPTAKAFSRRLSTSSSWLETLARPRKPPAADARA